jgi:hypothetical protein
VIDIGTGLRFTIEEETSGTFPFVLHPPCGDVRVRAHSAQARDSWIAAVGQKG